MKHLPGILSYPNLEIGKAYALLNEIASSTEVQPTPEIVKAIVADLNKLHCNLIICVRLCRSSFCYDEVIVSYYVGHSLLPYGNILSAIFTLERL